MTGHQHLIPSALKSKLAWPAILRQRKTTTKFSRGRLGISPGGASDGLSTVAVLYPPLALSNQGESIEGLVFFVRCPGYAKRTFVRHRIA